MTIIKKFETDELRPRFPGKYYTFIGVVLLMLITLEIWANNTLATYGERFASISKLQKSFALENQILQNEIARKSSLIHIATESASLGFSSAESIQYIR